MSHKIIIDPAGDMVLVVPYNQPLSAKAESSDTAETDASPQKEAEAAAVKAQDRELLISSKILSMASPVFQAMLGGRFREGLALSDAKASPGQDPFRLSLPDDDAEAMELLCKVLHFKVDGIPVRPSSNLLLSLAGICDKYQCIQVLQYCGGLWVRNWMLHFNNCQGSAPIDDICRLFIFAYVADLALEFCEVAWRLLLDHKGPLAGEQTQATELIDHPLLPQNVGSYLDGKRFRFCDAYHRALMGPLTTWKWASLSSGCLRAREAIANYTNVLRGAKVVPYDLDFRGHSLAFLLNKAGSLGYLSVRNCSGYRCSCEGDREDSLTKDLRVVAANVPKNKVWFGCLDCLRKGETPTKDRKCRIPHGDVSNLLLA